MFNLFNKPAFGIDVSDYSVELLALENISGSVRATSYARKVLARGVVEDGNIHNAGKLVNILDKLFDEAVPVSPRGRRVIASLPESKTFIHVFSVPRDLKDKELAQLVRSEAKKLIPIEEKHLYYDFWVDRAYGDKADVLYAASERRLVDDFSAVFSQAGFELVALDLESASIARAILREAAPEDTVCILDIGARTANFTIYRNGLIRFSGTVFMGGIHFTQELSQKLNILPERAEALKREVGLDPEREDGKVMLVLQSIFQKLIVEIKEITAFYEKRTKQRIQRGFLVGGSSLVPGLVDYLNQNMKIKFMLADPWHGIIMPDASQPQETDELSLSESHPVMFTNVIGLALRGLEKNPEKAGINLLPKKPSSLFWQLSKT